MSKYVTVKHAHLQEADDQLSLWVEEHTDATHVLLCGPGGVGKSKILNVVAERFKDEESARFAVPVLELSPTPPDQGPYLRLDYYWQIIDALNEHLLVRELVGNVAHGVDEQLEWRKLVKQSRERPTRAGWPLCPLRFSQYQRATGTSWTSYSFCPLSCGKQNGRCAHSDYASSGQEAEFGDGGASGRTHQSAP